jgi:hypothetical protein
MLLLNYGFKWKKENCTWRHPFVITDKGSNKLSFSNVRLTRTKKQYINSARSAKKLFYGWCCIYQTFCF